MSTYPIAASSSSLHRPMPGWQSVVHEVIKVPQIRVSRYNVGWIDSVLESVERLAVLQNNWDGRGAAAANVADVLEGLMFLERVMREETRAPSIAPLTSGGIEMSWHVAGLEVEAIFDERRDERVLLVSAGAQEWDEPIEHAEKLFADVADRLVDEEYAAR